MEKSYGNVLRGVLISLPNGARPMWGTPTEIGDQLSMIEWDGMLLLGPVRAWDVMSCRSLG